MSEYCMKSEIIQCHYQLFQLTIVRIALYSAQSSHFGSFLAQTIKCLQFVSQMRITNIFVKDAVSVQEYAYCQDKNASYRQEMEDNFVAEDNIIPYGVGFFAILDGHGGSDVSEYCAKNLPQIFKEQYQRDSSSAKKIFERICKRVDKQVAQINALQTGSTCCLVMIRYIQNKRVCCIANLGDTRAIICTEKQIAKRVSIDHKVTNPSEEDRIRCQGGTIIKGRVAGQLAITRALGDLELKSCGVSNIPDYEEVEINDKTLYMIVASDGLWDVCEDQQAVQLCKQCNNSKQMATKLVKYALNNGSRDNTSVLVLKF